MKKIGIFIATLLVLLISSYPVMGYFIAREYPHILQKLALNSHSQINVVSYKRGFFTSHSKLLVTLNALDAKIPLVIQQTIHHGPLVFSSHKNPSHTLFGLARIDSRLGEEINDAAHTFVKFNGDTETKLDLKKSIFLSNPEKTIIYKLNGLKVNLEIKSRGNTINTAVFSHEFSSRMHDTDRTFINLRYFANAQQESNSIWVGKKQFYADKLMWAKNKNTTYTLEKIHFASDTNLKEKKLNTLAKINVRNFAINNSNFGTQNIDLSIDDIDTNALIELKKSLTKSKEDEQIQLLSAKLWHLMNKGIVLNITDLKLNTAWGEVSSKSYMRLPNSNSTYVDSTHLLSNLNAQINVQIPALLMHDLLLVYYKSKDHDANETVLNQAVQAHINNWVNQSYMTLLGKDYWIHFRINQGEWSPDKKPLLNPPMTAISENT